MRILERLRWDMRQKGLGNTGLYLILIQEHTFYYFPFLSMYRNPDSKTDRKQIKENDFSPLFRNF